jgi:hypothetical protein
VKNPDDRVSKHYRDWTLNVHKVSLACAGGEIAVLRPIVGHYQTLVLFQWAIGHDLTLGQPAVVNRMTQDLSYRVVNLLALMRTGSADVIPGAGPNRG